LYSPFDLASILAKYSIYISTGIWSKGGIWLAEINFQSKEDAQKFYHHLLRFLNITPENQTILLNEDGHTIQILEEGLSDQYLEKVKKAFYEFIIKIKRDDWFRRILAENYFYDDPEEQQQIMEIIYSILEGEREDLAALLEKTNEEPKIMDAIEQIFKENISLSFDSFIKFRLRSYLQVLENYTELSIDEYKMEQEYQMFVQTLREFLQNREPKINILHLIFGEEMIFYNADFEEIKRSDLFKMIDRKLLFNHPVYVDSASIAPLLSIAPTVIYLYTKNPEEPLIRTIKNIFEERVIIHTFQEIHETMEWGKWCKRKNL
jgi:putative sporulation protein YtxC